MSPPHTFEMYEMGFNQNMVNKTVYKLLGFPLFQINRAQVEPKTTYFIKVPAGDEEIMSMKNNSHPITFLNQVELDPHKKAIIYRFISEKNANDGYEWSMVRLFPCEWKATQGDQFWKKWYSKRFSSYIIILNWIMRVI